MYSFEDMVEEVYSVVATRPYDEKAKFVDSSQDDLILYHSNLGRWIRNRFKLWGRDWVPQIERGCDISPNHPDAISMAVIEEVWKRLRNVKLSLEER